MPLAEALATFATDPARVRQFGQAGRERLRRHFSLDKMVGETELLHREVLEDRRRA